MCKDEFVEIISKQTELSVEDAERATKSVLLTLRSRLTPVELVELDSSLACDLDELWNAGLLQSIVSRLQSIRELDRYDFLEQIREAADLKNIEDAEAITQSVFSVLKSVIPQHEVEAISNALPNDLREFWQNGKAAA